MSIVGVVATAPDHLIAGICGHPTECAGPAPRGAAADGRCAPDMPHEQLSPSEIEVLIGGESDVAFDWLLIHRNPSEPLRLDIGAGR